MRCGDCVFFEQCSKECKGLDENECFSEVGGCGKFKDIRKAVEDLKRHIFELSYALDSQSAGKDFVALRSTHYDNQRWLHDNGFTEEYYNFWFNEHFGEENKK